MAETFYITVKVDAPTLEAANHAVGDAIDHYIDRGRADPGIRFRATWPHVNSVEKPDEDQMEHMQVFPETKPANPPGEDHGFLITSGGYLNVDRLLDRLDGMDRRISHASYSGPPN